MRIEKYNREVGDSVLRVFDKIQKNGGNADGLMILLECLKLLWLGFEVVKHFLSRKREKAMIDALESFNHRLNQLEEERRKFP